MSAQSKQSKPSPRWQVQYPAKVLVLSAVLGGLAWWGLFPSTWHTQWSYQLKSSGQTQAPASLQAAMLKSSPVLGKTVQQLNQQGVKGWTAQTLSQHLNIALAPDTQLLEVTVSGPTARESEVIAQTLDRNYRQVLAQIESERLEALKEDIKSQLADTQNRLQKGEANWKSKTGGFSTDLGVSGLWASDQALLADYQALSQKLRQTQSDLVSAQTHYRHYKGLLHHDEATLLKAVALGEDPVLQKLNSQLAEAQSDSGIQSVGLTNSDALGETTHQARIEYLQSEVAKERSWILGAKQPVIRDSVRKGLIGDLIQSRAAIESAKRSQQKLQSERASLLKDLDVAAQSMAQADAWSLEKRLLTEERHQLQKQLKALAQQKAQPQTVVKVIEAPLTPVENPHTSEKSQAAAGVFAGSFLFLAALPLLVKRVEQSARKPQQTLTSLAELTQTLAQSAEQKVVLMLPLSGDAHNNTSVHLGGLLNQCGRPSVVMDVDLTQRTLSQQLNLVTQSGVLEHLLNSELKVPAHEALTGADVLPLETTLTRQQVAEFTQITKRLPRLFERWQQSVVLLDTPRWHEAYGELMPYISQVVFYGASGQPSNQPTSALPQILASQYGVPIQLVQT